jgi:hypothetical protein
MSNTNEYRPDDLASITNRSNGSSPRNYIKMKKKMNWRISMRVNESERDTDFFPPPAIIPYTVAYGNLLWYLDTGTMGF